MGLFGFGKKRSVSPAINWIKLDSEDDLDQLIKKDSFQKPVILFKHSTRCSISSMAMNRLENYWEIDAEAAIPVFVDLIQYRSISNKIEAYLGVRHQSPQILIVKNGKCTYRASHSEISADYLKRNL